MRRGQNRNPLQCSCFLNRSGGGHVDLPQDERCCRWNGLDPNQKPCAGTAYSSLHVRQQKAKAMFFNSSGLRDELQSLNADVAALLNTKADGFFDASKSRADALADQVKVALN